MIQETAPIRTTEDSVPSVADTGKPSQTLIDDIFRERCLRARRMTESQRFIAAFEIFAFACGMVRSGVRHQFPAADEVELERQFRRRFLIQRRIDEHKIYVPCDGEL